MERIKPERVIEILKKNGLEINFEQAKVILDFLHKLANIAVTQSLDHEADSRLVYKSKHRRTGG